MTQAPVDPSDAQIIATTRTWLERVVLGLALCPFAAVPYQQNRIRFVVSRQRTTDGLLEELVSELTTLHQTDAADIETTLLIHPWVLADFPEYNDFLDVVDAVVEGLDLAGELQVASFHPAYQFADAPADDASHHTNRSPYPMLHLLREASVSAAVDTHPDIDSIPSRNQRVLRELPPATLQALFSRLPD